MNMKKIILPLAGSALLSSCAVAGGSGSGIESKLIEQNRRAVGVYRIELTEPILMSLEGRCNVPLFVIEARKESKIDNVIDIVMIETCSSAEPGKTVCECEYSGIGILYSDINNPDEASTSDINNPDEASTSDINNLDEASTWMGSVKQTSKEKEKNDIPSTKQMAQKRNWKDHVRKETNE